MTDLNTALLLDSQYAEVYFFRAIVRAECENYSGAIADGEKFLGLRPNTGDAEQMREHIVTWQRKRDGA